MPSCVVYDENLYLVCMHLDPASSLRPAFLLINLTFHFLQEDIVK